MERINWKIITNHSKNEIPDGNNYLENYKKLFKKNIIHDGKNLEDGNGLLRIIFWMCEFFCLSQIVVLFWSESPRLSLVNILLISHDNKVYYQQLITWRSPH